MKTNAPRKQQPNSPPPRRAKKVRPSIGEQIKNALPWLAPGAALVLMSLIFFLPALRGGFVWDDIALSAEPMMGTVTGLKKIWSTPGFMRNEVHYWPMVYTSFWLEHKLWGNQPAGYHLTNLLLHGACAVLLWRLLRRLVVPGAWLAAALFTVHPVHAESVAWIISRKDVLSGAFYLGSAIAFFRFYELYTSSDNLSASRRSIQWKWYGLALALFALALLSKAIAVTLPAALGLMLWWRHGRLGRRDLLALGPVFLVAAALTAVDMYVIKVCHSVTSQHGIQLPLAERVLFAGHAFWVYVSKLVWPHPLVTFYPQWPVHLNTPGVWMPLAACGGLFVGLCVAYRWLGRGPLAAVGYYGLTLGPILGLVDFYYLHLSFVADRYQYLASAGPLALLAAGLAGLIGRAERSKQLAGAMRGGLAVLLVLLGMMCWRQAGLYRDEVTLFSHSVKVYPKCWSAQHYLGWSLMSVGRSKEAIPAIKEGMRLATRRDPMANLGLALALEKEKRFKEAEEAFKGGLKISPNNGKILEAYAKFLESQGRMKEAVEQYCKAVNLEKLNEPGQIEKMVEQFSKYEEIFH